jgi:hypothetical protein
MISIELTARQRELIRIWIDNSRVKAGHYGDGASVFPDEARIEEKISEEGKVRLTRHQIEMLLDLSSGLNVDEIQLIKILQDGLDKILAGDGEK